MGKITLLLMLVFTLFGLFLFQNLSKKSYVFIDTIRFKAEFAETQKSKEIGLSKYKSIDNDFALVFPFEKNTKPVFWMKDMLFPIDIIFVKDYKIIQIYSNVPNPTDNNGQLPLYTPKNEANIVIEINSGLSKKYNFKEGDQIKIIK
ncbi:MAG: hypothetical protein A3B38_03355 [Candidatus Levybacteria bacterium RIFCSPLOWO2_01_FULL_36_13]|nr:MAG: hypothetical protein A2684_04300 [Candidatus Levybacteria bacterium RIFCSPHIGHO2_01_FULL_36_15b]OGH34718.1 MAG: hypothetical protein A3B38_03355 [Candidatus Levybacteria bacterium RIFCSPLOWO2_01_FULL_36_13]